MDKLDAIHGRERKKWDAIAVKLLENRDQLIIPAGKDFIYAASRSSRMAGVAEYLGELKGKKLLEIGCGAGKSAALLSRSGAEVTAFDLSEISVRTARLRWELNNLEGKILSLVASGEDLPFPDNSFDLMFGSAILHHLDVRLGSRELLRVLKPGGRAVFVEPLGTNRLLTFFRHHVRYPYKNPVGDDVALSYETIKAWGDGYTEFYWKEVHLVGMLERVFPYKWRIALRRLHELDRTLLKKFPSLRRFARYVVLFMKK